MIMMSENGLCNDCKHFTGYDGVNELWTGCTYGDFKGSKKVCKNYNKKTTKTDLQNRIKELEEEKVELMEDCACQYRQIQKLESENDDLRTTITKQVEAITEMKGIIYMLEDLRIGDYSSEIEEDMQELKKAYDGTLEDFLNYCKD